MDASNQSPRRQTPRSMNDLLIDTDRGPRKLSACLDDWQQQDFVALSPGWQQVIRRKEIPGSIQRAYLERPRGHSKTADLAVMVAWALLAAEHKIVGVAAAGDKDQARLLRDAVDKLTRLNPWMMSRTVKNGKETIITSGLDVQAYRIANPRTGSYLDILSADAPSSYGLTCDFVICDEITHWPKRDLWDSLISAAAKRKHCLVIVIANAGFGDSWQFEIRETVRLSNDWHFHRLDGPQASWISKDLLDEQRRLLPDIAFRRLWLNEWSAGAGDAIAESDITAALKLDGPAGETEKGWAYVAGLDLSTSRDATVLAVLGVHTGWTESKPKEKPVMSHAARLIAESDPSYAPAEDECEYVHHDGSGRIKLMYLKVWMPMGGNRIDLTEVEQTVADTHQQFGLSSVAADPWQAEHMTQRLQSAGVPVDSVHFTPQALQAMATATMDVFRERNIELFTDKLLLADLRNLQVVERAGGFRLQSPRGSKAGTPHGDAATALMLALYAAREFNLSPPAVVDGPLVCWP